MTREETIIILGILKASYSNFYKDMAKRDLETIVNVWSELFQNDDVNLVKLAVKELIQTQKYPPAIADVKNKMAQITSKEKEPTELWAELHKAIKNSTYHSEEEFAKLSPEVKRYVRNPAQLKELAQMDSDIINSVTKGQFLKQIDQIQKKDQEEKQMLPETKKYQEMIKQIGMDVSGLLSE